MTYKVEITSGARRTIHRLPRKVAFAVLDVIEGPLAAQPHRVGKPLQDELEGLWSCRVADYRVLYAIHEDIVVVRVARIAHRSDAYR